MTHYKLEYDSSTTFIAIPTYRRI